MNQEEEWLESAEPRPPEVIDKEHTAHQRELEARSLGQPVPIVQTHTHTG